MPNKLRGKAPKRCKGTHAGSVTGYRHHMMKRRTNRKHMVCDDCREAMRRRMAEYRKLRIMNGAKSVQRDEASTRHYKLTGGLLMIDVTGTRRRLQALAALGWSWDELGARLGIHGNGLGYIVRRRKYTYPDTAGKIKALYDELQMIPAPPKPINKGNPRKVILTRAQTKGWLPPLAWEDELIDDPYHLPSGMDDRILWNWFNRTASEIEKIEWVLENGFPRPPRK